LTKRLRRHVFYRSGARSFITTPLSGDGIGVHLEKVCNFQPPQMCNFQPPLTIGTVVQGANPEFAEVVNPTIAEIESDRS